MEQHHSPSVQKRAVDPPPGMRPEGTCPDCALRGIGETVYSTVVSDRKLKTNSSLALRLMLFIVLPLLLSVLGLGYLVLGQLEEHVEEQMQKDVELVARAVQGPLSRSLERERGGTVQETLDSVFDIGRIYGAYLYNDRGEVMAAAGTVSTNRQLEARITRVVETERRTGEYGRVDGRNVYSYFVPLKDSEERLIGLLQIARRESEIKEYLTELRGLAAVYFFGGTLLMTGIILIGYHGALGRSLGNLRKSMSRVRHGDRRHRAETTGPREIAELARSLNRMLDSMVAAEQEIEEGKAARRTLTEKLESSQKLAALGEMAAGVAHELGTPLSVLDGKAQRALRPSRDPEAVRTYLREIREDVRGMENVVRQLLEFGRPGAKRNHRIRADQAAERARSGAEQTVNGSAGRLVLDGPVPGPQIDGDPVRIELALKNLFQNALQASPDGTVEAGWHESDGTVVFTVADNGPGIPSEMREKIFTPFFTTKDGQRGRGLGLAIVQQVVTEHNGRVEIDESPAGGARFRLIFPAAEAPGQAATEPPVLSSAEPLHRT